MRTFFHVRSNVLNCISFRFALSIFPVSCGFPRRVFTVSCTASAAAVDTVVAITPSVEQDRHLSGFGNTFSNEGLLPLMKVDSISSFRIAAQYIQGIFFG